MPKPLTLPTLTCLRCAHTWYPRRPERPAVCPHCKSPYWDRKRQTNQKAKGGKNDQYVSIVRDVSGSGERQEVP